MRLLLVPLTLIVPSQREVDRWNLKKLARAYEQHVKVQPAGVLQSEDKFVVYDGHHRVYSHFEQKKTLVEVNLIEKEADIWNYDAPFYSSIGDDDIFKSEVSGTLYYANDISKKGIKSIADMFVNEEE